MSFQAYFTGNRQTIVSNLNTSLAVTGAVAESDTTSDFLVNFSQALADSYNTIKNSDELYADTSTNTNFISDTNWTALNKLLNSISLSRRLLFVLYNGAVTKMTPAELETTAETGTRDINSEAETLATTSTYDTQLALINKIANASERAYMLQNLKDRYAVFLKYGSQVTETNNWASIIAANGLLKKYPSFNFCCMLDFETAAAMKQNAKEVAAVNDEIKAKKESMEQGLERKVRDFTLEYCYFAANAVVDNTTEVYLYTEDFYDTFTTLYANIYADSQNPTIGKTYYAFRVDLLTTLMNTMNDMYDPSQYMINYETVYPPTNAEVRTAHGTSEVTSVVTGGFLIIDYDSFISQINSTLNSYTGAAYVPVDDSEITVSKTDIKNLISGLDSSSAYADALASAVRSDVQTFITAYDALYTALETMYTNVSNELNVIKNTLNSSNSTSTDISAQYNALVLTHTKTSIQFSEVTAALLYSNDIIDNSLSTLLRERKFDLIGKLDK